MTTVETGLFAKPLIRGVLFDFAGTLLMPESPRQWVQTVVERRGVHLSAEETDTLGAQLVEAGRPGPTSPARLAPEHAELFAHRDLSRERHRAAYTKILDTVTLPEPVTADDLYNRCCEPSAWVPYADSLTTLVALRAARVRIAVVSNIGFELRPIFQHHGLDSYVTTYVLSCDLQIQKPDPELFHLACDRLGIGVKEALVVGDSANSDGAAVDAGIRTLLLPMSECGTVHGLDSVVSLAISVGLSGSS